MAIQKYAALAIMCAGLSACGTMANAPESDLQYQRVHEVELSQPEIFNRTQEWLAMTFVDSKEVIEVANADTGTIIGKGSTQISPTGIVSIPVRMTIKVEAKPGRYRTTYSDYTGYYGQYRTTPYPVKDIRSVGQVRQRIKEIDASLLEYLRGGEADDSW